MEGKYITMITFALAILLANSGYCANICPYSSDGVSDHLKKSTACNPKIHDCKKFNEKILYYKGKLEPYFEKIKLNQSLSASEVEAAIKIVKEYYLYLINNNIVYAKLARDVVNNQGAFARLANTHLEHRAEVEGKLDQLDKIANNIRISLAYSDAKLRSECTEYVPYEAIAKYHYDMFALQGLSKYAWGGILFELFAGSGSWMNAGGYDKEVDLKLTSLTSALIFNKEVDGIKAREALKTVLYIPIEHFGDSALAAIYRILVTFRPSSN